ncbi:MAG: sulfate permease, partial [Balneolaceae bacterium]
YGLYASMIPLLFYAVLGTSRQLAVGPVAMVSLLVLAGVGEFADPGSGRFIQLAILTALGVGLVQLLMGIFRMGFLVNFLSHPVLSGFTSAAAVIIGASQLPGLLGIDLAGNTGSFHEIAAGVLSQITETDPVTAAVGTGSLAAIILMKKWNRVIPSALVAVVAGTAAAAFLQLHQYGLSTVGEVPQGLPSFSLPDIAISDVTALLPMILVISLVSYMESVAVAKAVANKRGYKIDSNQELIALGGANIGGALFQSFPTTGGFSRTAVNDQAGARTTLASVITASLIGLTVLFLTPLFHHLPYAVLASIIIVAVAGLFDSREMVHLWKTDKKDLAMLAVTFLTTLVLGIEEGIAVGVVMSLVMVIYSSTKPHYAELGRLGNTNNFRNIRRYEEATTENDILIYRFDSSLYFANTEHFRDTLEEKMEKRGENLRLVILDATAIYQIDSTGIHAMENLIRDLQMRRVELYLAGVIGPVRDKLKRSGITEIMGKENFFFDAGDAVECYRSPDKRDKREFSAWQTND